MSDEPKPISERYDVIERRILAQGPSVEEWAVEVAHVVDAVWTTTFYVGPRSFQLANNSSDRAEEHCMFIGEQFAKALWSLLGKSDGHHMHPMHQQRMLGLRGHCSECNAVPGQPCKR